MNRPRFSYEHTAVAVEESRVEVYDEDGEVTDEKPIEMVLEGYGIFDAKRGLGEGQQIAIATDRDAAELIVAALNGSQAPSITIVGEAGLREIEREGGL
jgi:hypothetical protein